MISTSSIVTGEVYILYVCGGGEYVYVYLCRPFSSMRGGYCLGPTDVVLSNNFALESSAQVKLYIGP